MLFINSVFIIWIFWLLGFVINTNSNLIQETMVNDLFLFKALFDYYPFSINNLNILSFILFLTSFAFYYSLFKKFSPRWRVYSANKIIKNIRNNIDNNKFEQGQIISYLRKIDPFIFEEILLSLMYERGFKIKRNKRYTGDGGSDGLCWIDGKKTHIQAKRYSSYIKKSHFDEFKELIEKDKTKGLFIHTGKTSKNILNEKNEKLDIISGKSLISLILGEKLNIFDKNREAKRKIKNK
jgi:restriction system protein